MTGQTPQLFAELTREELKEVARDGLVILPIGATEQHGPHLPTGTDALTVEWIARASVARIAGEVPTVVAPTLSFGSSAHHLPFGGTMSLTTETFGRVLHDLGYSLVSSGFRRIFILNGHGGNHELAQVAARDLSLELPVHVGCGSWWVMAWEALAATGAFADGRVPGHAGAIETSVILALRPNLVKEPRPKRDGPFDQSDPRSSSPPYRTELHGSWQRIDGYSDSPVRGSAERGELILEAAVGAVASGLLTFWSASSQLPQ
jgi:creatinine amidohydrolase